MRCFFGLIETSRRVSRGLSWALALLLLPSEAATAQSPTWQWGLQSTNPTPNDGSGATGYAVAADASGRVVVGGFYQPIFLSGTATSRAFGSAGTVASTQEGFVAQASAAGQWNWVTNVVATGATNVGGTPLARVFGVAATAAGDVYAVGQVSARALRIGNVAPSLPASGDALFVARLNSIGICQWVQLAEGAFGIVTLALDPSTGGVVMAGTYQDNVSIGGTALPASASASATGAFVARINASGQWLAATAVAGTAEVQSLATLAVGPAGQVAIAGRQRPGTAVFGSATLTVPASATERFFVAQLSPTNQWQWAVGGSGSASSRADGLAYTPAGSLWVGGGGLASTVVGPLTLRVPAGATSNSRAGFLAQLSTTGQWGTGQQVSPGGNGSVFFGPLALDGAGNVIATGGLRSYSGTMQATFGSNVLVTAPTGSQSFVASLTNAGQWRYAVSVPPAARPDGYFTNASTLDNQGNLYLAGTLVGNLTMGNGLLTGSFPNSQANSYSGDAVLLRLANAAVLAARADKPAPPLLLFPNPAHHTATILLPAFAPGEARALTLRDALGRAVRRFAPGPAPVGTPYLMDLAGLAPGLYLLQAGAARARLMVE